MRAVGTHRARLSGLQRPPASHRPCGPAELVPDPAQSLATSVVHRWLIHSLRTTAALVPTRRPTARQDVRRRADAARRTAASESGHSTPLPRAIPAGTSPTTATNRKPPLFPTHLTKLVTQRRPRDMIGPDNSRGRD